VKFSSLRISCCSVGQVPSPKPATMGRQIGRSEPFTIENFLLLSWASPRPPTRPPGCGQIDQSELFIIDNLFLLTWTSPRPETRPQGAAKMLRVRTRSVDAMTGT
jgi:hypothetical protein